MKILMIDNYDSFTYNLVHYLEENEQVDVIVKRNDEFQLDEVAAFDKIILSPGPGIPSEAGLMMKLLDKYASQKSILGICLGHQAIGEHFGAKLKNLDTVYHGQSLPCNIILNTPLFTSIDKTFMAGRYHSWVIDKEGFPYQELEITAEDENGLIMGIKHKKYDIQGLQFHPESILTPDGKKIIQNWIKA